MQISVVVSNIALVPSMTKVCLFMQVYLQRAELITSMPHVQEMSDSLMEL